LEALPAPSSAIVKVSCVVKVWVAGAPGVRNSRRMSSAWVEGALGAGEVVLGKVGDLLEEVGAALVVEEPGREGLGGRSEAGEGFVQDGFVDGEGSGGGHGASWSFKGRTK
jgi:uncharacterized membrane protein YgcG